jgi:hypothetical protein
VIDAGRKQNFRFRSVHCASCCPLCLESQILVFPALIGTSFLLLCRMLARPSAPPLVTAQTPEVGIFITAVSKIPNLAC